MVMLTSLTPGMIAVISNPKQKSVL